MKKLRITINKIRIDRFLVWRVGVLAFLFAFAVVSLLSIRFLVWMGESSEQVNLNDSFEPRVINEALLKEVFDKIEKKRNVFEGALLKKPTVKSP